MWIIAIRKRQMRFFLSLLLPMLPFHLVLETCFFIHSNTSRCFRVTEYLCENVLFVCIVIETKQHEQITRRTTKFRPTHNLPFHVNIQHSVCATYNLHWTRIFVKEGNGGNLQNHQYRSVLTCSDQFSPFLDVTRFGCVELFGWSSIFWH